MEIKKIKQDDPLLVANLTHCFEDLGEINMFVRGLEKAMKTEFSPTEPAHVELLKQFWEGMMPETRMPSFVGEGSDDWTLLGFQGKKPQTDFRGMGILGLTQLAWFAKHRGQRARECLRESTVQPRYFPFAATGINITAFLVELVHDTRFHARLLELAERGYMNKSDPAGNQGRESEDREPLLGEGSSSSSSSSSGSEHGGESTWRHVPNYGSEEELHMVYCDFYSAFVALWVKRNPASIMEFPSVFADFKDGIQRNAVFSTLVD